MSRAQEIIQRCGAYSLFVGIHSLLLGLLPFFLPVYLIKKGYSLADVAMVVGWTGLGFCLALYLFERLRTRYSCLQLILASLAFQLILVVLLCIDTHLLLLGVANGFYACWYWTLQRIMFYSRGDESNSGRRFGNFQIYVLVVLKTGIILGSFLLEHWGVFSLLILSMVISTGGGLLFVRLRGLSLPKRYMETQSLEFAEIVSFRDQYRSRTVFAVDGIFLYLESYFWLISLFLLVKKSFLQLGLLIVVLALALALLFFMIKNRVDMLHGPNLLRTAICLYALSWLLRAELGIVVDSPLLMPTLLLIAFLTSFFRLVFNKCFFDLAAQAGGYRYVLMKSFHSQWWLGLVFLFVGAMFLSGRARSLGGTDLLSCLYYLAAVISLVYLRYRPFANQKELNMIEKM